MSGIQIKAWKFNIEQSHTLTIQMPGIQIVTVQWGSEYQVFGIQMVKNRLDAKWSGFRMPSEYRTAQAFEYLTNGCHLVFLCTGPVF